MPIMFLSFCEKQADVNVSQDVEVMLDFLNSFFYEASDIIDGNWHREDAKMK